MKAARLQVNVVRCTKKAKLVEASDGRKSWMQNRWIKVDGQQLTVNEETFNRGYFDLTCKNNMLEQKRALKYGFYDLPPVQRETEKAIGINARLVRESTDEVIERMVWFPKSQLNNSQAPGWLIEAKLKDVLAEISNPWGVDVHIGDFKL